MSTPKQTTIKVSFAISEKLDTYNTGEVLREEVTTLVPGDSPDRKTARRESLAALRELRDKITDRFDTLIEEEEKAAEENPES